MKKYEEILKRNNPVQNALALEYLLLNGRNNLLDNIFYKNLEDNIRSKDDKNSIIANSFALDSLKIARDIANLNTKELSQYIYEKVKEERKLERNR